MPKTRQALESEIKIDETLIYMLNPRMPSLDDVEVKIKGHITYFGNGSQNYPLYVIEMFDGRIAFATPEQLFVEIEK